MPGEPRRPGRVFPPELREAPPLRSPERMARARKRPAEASPRETTAAAMWSESGKRLLAARERAARARSLRSPGRMVRVRPPVGERPLQTRAVAMREGLGKPGPGVPEAAGQALPLRRPERRARPPAAESLHGSRAAAMPGVPEPPGPGAPEKGVGELQALRKPERQAGRARLPAEVRPHGRQVAAMRAAG